MTERWLVVLFRCCPFALWFVEIIQHFPVLVYFLHTDVSLSHCWWYRWYIYVDVCLLPCLLEWSPAFASLEFFSPSSSVIVNTGAWHARKIFSPQNMQVTASSKTLMHFNKPVMRPKKTRKVRSFSRDESMASNDQRSSAVSLDLMHMKAKPHKSMERKLLRMTGSLRGAWEGNCCGVLSQTRSFTWSWHRKSNSFRGKVQLPDDMLHSPAPVGVVSDRKSSWNMMGPMKSVSPVENLSHPRQSLRSVRNRDAAVMVCQFSSGLSSCMLLTWQKSVNFGNKLFKLHLPQYGGIFNR